MIPLGFSRKNRKQLARVARKPGLISEWTDPDGTLHYECTCGWSAAVRPFRGGIATTDIRSHQMICKGVKAA